MGQYVFRILLRQEYEHNNKIKMESVRQAYSLERKVNGLFRPSLLGDTYILRTMF
jgi:hypothetical protein